MPRALLTVALATVIACLGPFGLASAADTQQPAAPRSVFEDGHHMLIPLSANSYGAARVCLIVGPTPRE